MAEASGAQWCPRYPTSAKVEDLIEPFRGNVTGFLSALRMASALVQENATYRPLPRAYLMHWSWAIARGLPANMCRPGDKPGVPVSPASVPAFPGIDIDWKHGGDLAAARAAAEAMVLGYGLKYCASLTGRHMDRRAIDMSISWTGTLSIRDRAGAVHKISEGPRDGSNPQLAAVGKTFGVLKLVSDPPHWSDDGH